MEQNTVSQYDDDLTVGMEETEDFLDTGFVDLFEHSSSNDSPISRLKTIVLSIDWEINNEILTQFNDELLVLKDIWQGDQVKLVYIQALEKISRYIYQLKADAHPNAIKLLLTFYYNLEKIVLDTALSDDDIKNILRGDVKKFEHLKQQIGFIPAADKSQPVEKPGAVSPAAEQAEPHPILFNLKACILGMDWEITERELADLGNEVTRLENEFAGRKPQMIFLQGIGALGGYIKLKKSDAHADAFKLLFSFYEGLEKIVVNPGLSKEAVKEILLPEVEKFEDFKQVIASTITPEALADRDVDEDSPAYGDSAATADSPAPAFSDVPEEIHGFQAEEEAVSLGTSDDVEDRLDNFLSGEEPSGTPGEEGALPPEAAERIDSFFGEDLVDTALSVSSVSAEDALRGVDVETEADDDSDEEALPIQEDGVLAPALADSADAEAHGFNPEGAEDGSLYSANDVDDSINDIFADDAADQVVSQTAALKGVDVETDADDDSDEQPLPKEDDDIAPALALDDGESEIVGGGEREDELSEIDTRIDSFFGDIQDDEAMLETVSSDAGDDDTTDVSGLREEEEISEVFEDDFNAFFAEPEEESASAAPPETMPEYDADVPESDELPAEHATGPQVPIEVGEEEEHNIIDEDVWDDMLVDESPAESSVAAAEPAGEEDDEVLFEAIADDDAAGELEEIPLGLLEDELETETEPEEQEPFGIADSPVTEEELAVETETETDPEEGPAAFGSSEPSVAGDELETETEPEEQKPFGIAGSPITEEELVVETETETDPEEGPAAFGTPDQDMVEEQPEDEQAVGDEAEITRGSFFDVFAAGSGAASVTGVEADPGAEDVSVSAELDSARQDEPEIADNAEVVSSFGSDSEEEAFFASIDNRIDEPGEIQIELLTESDDVESELLTDHDEEDAELYDQGPEADSAGEMPEPLSEQQVTQPDMPLFAIDDELSGLRAGVASLGVEINDRIVDGLLTEINQVRQRMVSRPVDKTFLQLLSTIVQHIGHYKYEASADAHTLMLSVFDKLELCRKDTVSLEQSQEILLAETCKVLLWQQKMLDRQVVKQKDERRSVAPIHTGTAEMEKEGSAAYEDELQTIAGSEPHADSGSEQDFSAVFKPVDEEDFAAIEEIETTQETIEQELGDALLEDDQQVQEEDRSGSIEKESSGDTENLEEVVKPEGKIDVKGLSVLLSGMIKREMKGLKDLLQTELKSFKDKFKDKE